MTNIRGASDRNQHSREFIQFYLGTVDHMRNNTITSNFTKQFRKEDIFYPGNGAKKYANFSFKQFKGNQNEKTIISDLLTNKISDKTIITDLFEKLKKKDLADLRRLSCFSQKFQKTVSRFAKKEQNSSQYYRHLLLTLEQCTSLVNSFHNLIQNDLANKLKPVIRNKANSENTGYNISGDINHVLSGLERYSRPVQKYSLHFRSLFENETENCHYIPVTSQILQYLLLMVTFIQKVILDIKETSSLLKKWQKRLVTREHQELYN